MPDALVLMDYQNVHFTAHECFRNYGTPIYESLIEPGKFANQVAQAWQDDTGEELTVTKVLVYRGATDPRKEPKMNSRGLRQKAAWESDSRVAVTLRPMRYPRDWPDTKAQEKGVDVMLALALVSAAQSGEFDRLFIATRDTDLLPAIEMANDARPGTVTVVAWDGQSSLKAGSNVSSLSLDASRYRRSRDTRNYS